VKLHWLVLWMLSAISLLSAQSAQSSRKSEAGPRATVETRQLTLTSSASRAAAAPESRITLTLDVDLKPGMHLYAPGVQGSYISLDWQIAASPSKAWRAQPVSYPPSQMLNLPAIGETLPVYEGQIRLKRALALGGARELAAAGAGGSLKVTGSFRYQACDDRLCYPPRTVPLEWTFRVLPSGRTPAN
jgi:thiol:disulfide interchange protein DsbD